MSSHVLGLFVVYLMVLSASVLYSIKLWDDWWIGKDLDGNRNLGTIQVFVQGDSGKPSFKVASVLTKIFARYLLIA
jgi:hypothetical protein